MLTTMINSNSNYMETVKSGMSSIYSNYYDKWLVYKL